MIRSIAPARSSPVIRNAPRRAEPMLAAGLMSGTSADGLDVVVVNCDGGELRCIASRSVRYPEALRRRILICAEGRAGSWETAQLHHDLGRWYARQAAPFLARWGTRLRGVGLHGQTVYHQPSQPAVSTLQLGEPAYLAADLGIPVVSNFRAMDLAVGGQGAPLATLFHVRAFGQRGRHVCVQNLGGIGNVTSIDWRVGTRAPRVQAFDTGPGNMLIDAAMMEASDGRQRMDREGRCAARGRPDLKRVAGWLRKDGFVRATPPKSTGRERYGDAFYRRVRAEMESDRLSQADAVATLTAYTAATVAANYARHLKSPPDRVILCGGGARNPVLRDLVERALVDRFGAVELMRSDDLGWPDAVVEGAAFALLAWERLAEQVGNLPATTGAARAVPCGQVTLPGLGATRRPGRWYG